MTKTLADITPQERVNCIEKWCADRYGNLYIYLGNLPGSPTHDKATGERLGTFINPQDLNNIEAPLHFFTPHPEPAPYS